MVTLQLSTLSTDFHKFHFEEIYFYTALWRSIGFNHFNGKYDILTSVIDDFVWDSIYGEKESHINQINSLIGRIIMFMPIILLPAFRRTNWQIPGVNFTNILCASFSYETVMNRFLYLVFVFVFFWRKKIAIEAICKILLKLTTAKITVTN